MNKLINNKTTARSIIGSREEQQDSYIIKSSRKSILAAVCDGIGGLMHGKIASETAANTLLELYRSNPSIPPNFLFPQAVERMDRAICEKVHEKHGEAVASSGSTVVAVVVYEYEMFWLSVGDSRIYHIRNRNIQQITEDHNYIRYLDEALAAGEINEEQYLREASHGSALTSFIGMGNVKRYDYNSVPFQLAKGDILLLTSDGLTKALNDNEILDILSEVGSIRKKADSLLKAVEQKNCPHQDNTTFILVYINK